MAGENAAAAGPNGRVLGNALLGIVATLLASLLATNFSFWASHINLGAKFTAFAESGDRYTKDRGSAVERVASRNESRLDGLWQSHRKLRDRVVTYQERALERNASRDRSLSRLEAQLKEVRAELRRRS